MLWLIDSCQNQLSADQHHVTISQAQVLEVLKLNADHALFFIKSRAQASLCGEEGSGKISVQINPWRVVDFSSDIFLVKI